MRPETTESLPHVGALDPERNTSPIVDEAAYDEEEPAPGPEAEAPVCYFNDEAFPHRACVQSGAEILQCERGVWVRRDERPDA